MAEVVDVVNQEFDLFVSFNSLHASPSSDEGDHFLDKCNGVLVPRLVLGCGMGRDWGSLVEPATKA